MTDQTFHVYALLSPDDDLVYYIGKTFKVVERFKQHVQQAKRLVRVGCSSPANRRERWLHELALEGREPLLAILEEVSIADHTHAAFDAANREASALEEAWIVRLRNAGHPLTNCNRSGQGEQAKFIMAAIERGQNLALSLGRES
jgi:hypothetical protein